MASDDGLTGVKNFLIFSKNEKNRPIGLLNEIGLLPNYKDLMKIIKRRTKQLQNSKLM